jgi:hypothetical protein
LNFLLEKYLKNLYIKWILKKEELKMKEKKEKDKKKKVVFMDSNGTIELDDEQVKILEEKTNEKTKDEDEEE